MTRLAAAWSRVLARPGGNVTGLSNLQNVISLPSDLNFCVRLSPGLRRLALWLMSTIRRRERRCGEVHATARTLGLEVVTLEIRRVGGYRAAFEALKGRAEALYVVADPLVNARTGSASTRLRWPRDCRRFTCNREYVEAAGLMSYGPNYLDLYRRAADYVDKILRGTKPADLPVEQPTKFDLVINLTTAKRLALIFRRRCSRAPSRGAESHREATARNVQRRRGAGYS